MRAVSQSWICSALAPCLYSLGPFGQPRRNSVSGSSNAIRRLRSMTPPAIRINSHSSIRVCGQQATWADLPHQETPGYHGLPVPTPRKSKEGERILAANRQATFHYEILERYEAGLVLSGTEVKSV